MKINKDKAWLIFYVTTAFMLGMLIMSCSSDDNEDVQQDMIFFNHFY